MIAGDAIVISTVFTGINAPQSVLGRPAGDGGRFHWASIRTTSDDASASMSA
jgi:hypothetical protein